MRMIVPKDSFSTSVSSSTSTSTATTTNSQNRIANSSSSPWNPPPPPPPPPGKKKRDHGAANPFICNIRRPKLPQVRSSVSAQFPTQRFQQQTHHANQHQDKPSTHIGMRLYNAKSCTPMATPMATNSHHFLSSKAAISRPLARGFLPPPAPPPPPPPPPKQGPCIDLSSHTDPKALVSTSCSTDDGSGNWSSSPMINKESWSRASNETRSSTSTGNSGHNVNNSKPNQQPPFYLHPVLKRVQQTHKLLSQNKNNSGLSKLSKASETNTTTSSSSSFSGDSGSKKATLIKTNSTSNATSEKTESDCGKSPVVSTSFSSEGGDKDTSVDKRTGGYIIRDTKVWEGGRGYHYANARHNVQPSPGERRPEEPHHNLYGGKIHAKSKFAIYSSKEVALPTNKDLSDSRLELPQIPKNETETTATTNSAATGGAQDDDTSSNTTEENQDDMRILRHYSSSSGSSFHFDIDVVKNNHSHEDRLDQPVDKGFVIMEEQASCFLSKSSSSTITSLPPTPYKPESRGPDNGSREGGNSDRVSSFLQQQQQHPPTPGPSPFSAQSPSAPSSPSKFWSKDFESCIGNNTNEEEDFVDFPAPTQVERQKVSSTDPFWSSQDQGVLSSEVDNNRSGDNADEHPFTPEFSSAWPSDGMQWPDEENSWIDFTADPFQGQPTASIKKPSPSKPANAQFKGHGNSPTKSSSSSPPQSAIDDAAWITAVPGFHESNSEPMTGSAFARLKKPKDTTPYFSSLPVEALPNKKIPEVQPQGQPTDSKPTSRHSEQMVTQSSFAQPNHRINVDQAPPHLSISQQYSSNRGGQSMNEVRDHPKDQQEHRRPRMPPLLGPLLEARYRSLRSASSQNDALGNQQKVASRSGSRRVNPAVTKASAEEDESVLLTSSSSSLLEGSFTKSTYDTGLLSMPENSQGSLTTQVFERYRKMTQLGLSEDVIHSAMRRDGVEPSLLPPSPDAGDSKPYDFPRPEQNSMDPFRRFRINWATHSNLAPNTLWAMVGRDESWMKETIHIDDDEFDYLFQQQKDPLSQSRPLSQVKKDGQASARIVDPKRAHNGDIIVTRLALSYREIARAIDNYDYETLSLDQMRNLLPFIPTAQEAAKLQDHITKAGGRHLLKSECEKFMVEMLSVDKATEKLHAMLFMKRFPLAIEEIQHNSRLLQKASQEILGSSRLRRCLLVLLHLGNRINTTGPAGSNKKTTAVASIQLQSLAKLGQAKAFDRKTSFLHYSAAILRRSDPDLVHFKDDLPSLGRAALNVDWAQLQQDVDTLEASLSNIRAMALNVHFVDSTCTAIPTTLSPDEEVRVLQSTPIGRFTLDACIRMAVAYQEVTACKQALEALLSYFGEQGLEDDSYGGEDAAGPQDVFRTLASFVNSFESAVEQSIAREKERSIRDSRETAAVISRGCAGHRLAYNHSNAAPQRSTGPLEQIRSGMGGVLGAIRCKTTMSSEEERDDCNP